MVGLDHFGYYSPTGHPTIQRRDIQSLGTDMTVINYYWPDEIRIRHFRHRRDVTTPQYGRNRDESN